MLISIYPYFFEVMYRASALSESMQPTVPACCLSADVSKLYGYEMNPKNSRRFPSRVACNEQNKILEPSCEDIEILVFSHYFLRSFISLYKQKEIHKIHKSDQNRKYMI
jgi:hypothetical protein